MLDEPFWVRGARFERQGWHHGQQLGGFAAGAAQDGIDQAAGAVPAGFGHRAHIGLVVLGDGAALDIQSALVASAAADVVDAHPDGLDLEVTDRGASLSGGQRQRVALARALVAQAPVMVLHDPTTAVDIRGRRPDGRD